jgi:hypothetical protein
MYVTSLQTNTKKNGPSSFIRWTIGGINVLILDLLTTSDTTGTAGGDETSLGTSGGIPVSRQDSDE